MRNDLAPLVQGPMPPRSHLPPTKGLQGYPDPMATTIMASGTSQHRSLCPTSFVEDLATHDLPARIKALRRPLLIFHPPQDRVVGIDNATAIFRAARHPKSFVSLDEADHLLTRSEDAGYAATVTVAWASHYLGSGSPLRSEAQPGYVTIEETGEGDFQVEVEAGGARFLADEPVDVEGSAPGRRPVTC